MTSRGFAAREHQRTPERAGAEDRYRPARGRAMAPPSYGIDLIDSAPPSPAVAQRMGWGTTLGLGGVLAGGAIALGTGLALAPGLALAGGLGAGGLLLGSMLGGGSAPAPAVPGWISNSSRNFPVDPACRGGSYGDMKKLSKRNVREADHTPPKSTYAGTPFKHYTENQMPAVSIAYSVHRLGQKGAGGGVSTTGSSAIVVQYRDEAIHALLVKGDFKGAMMEAFKDQKNAAPNALALANGQAEAALYALKVGLLKSQDELLEVLQLVDRITR